MNPWWYFGESKASLKDAILGDGGRWKDGLKAIRRV